MLRSLSSRLIVLIFIILAVGSGLAVNRIVKRQGEQFVEDTNKKAAFLSNTLVQVIEHEIAGHSRPGIQDLVDRVALLEDVVILRIFTETGQVVVSHNPLEVGRVVTDLGYEVFHDRRSHSLYRTTEGAPAFCNVEPIFNLPTCQKCHGSESEVVGVLEICLTMAPTFRKVAANRNFLIATLTVTGGIISLVLALFIAYLVNAPIRRLMGAMARIEAGDLSARVNLKGGDELSRLGKTFDHMVAELEESRETLESLHHEQLTKAERLASIGELAVGVAHEIKNPLAGIAGATQVLVSGISPDDPRREVAGEILNQTERLDRIIRDLLAFGHPQQGKPVPADLNRIIERTMFLIGQHPEKKKTSVRHHLDPDLPLIQINPDQIQQVLFNLVINALEVLGGKGEVQIATRYARGEEFSNEYVTTMGLEKPKGPTPRLDFVEITVADNGPGIDLSRLRDLFTPFYSRKEGGTGLGLSISKRIVDQNRGIIFPRNRPAGGSEFVIRFPISAK